MANQFYNNIVLENLYESWLKTKLDFNQFVTPDNLAPEDGLVKRINRYEASGQVDDLAIGADNSHSIEIGYTSHDYEVGTTQGKFSYRDEEAVKDSFAVESGIKGLAEAMVNDFTTKAVREWNLCSKQQSYTGNISFETVVDGLAQLDSSNLEGEADYSLIISIGAQAGFRKSLKDDLKYVEAFSRTGYIGHVCGVPVYTSKAIPDYEAYIVSKEAVRVFMQPAVEIEQDRVPGTRTNIVYARKLTCVALVDDRKVCHLGKATATATTITTKAAGAKVVAGAATTGSIVKVYVNGKLYGSATAASSAYSITGTDNLVAGDKIEVRAYTEGEIVSIATDTAA